MTSALEVEVKARETGGSGIALTLLRCVGWLSRDDYSSRNGHAGPFLETPGAQMPGRWSYDYAVIPFAAPDEAAARQQAYAFAAPLRAVASPLHPGDLADQRAQPGEVATGPTTHTVTAPEAAIVPPPAAKLPCSPRSNQAPSPRESR